jgi:hypothetical protein
MPVFVQTNTITGLSIASAGSGYVNGDLLTTLGAKYLGSFTTSSETGQLDK